MSFILWLWVMVFVGIFVLIVKEEGITWAIWGAVASSCMISGLVFLIMAKSNELPTPQNYPIVSLHNETHTQGSFFIGIGSVEGIEKYVVMQKLGNDTYSRLTFSSQGVIIRESSSEEPHVTAMVAHPTEFAAKWGKGNSYIDSYKEIVVPKGTVIQQFKIN